MSVLYVLQLVYMAILATLGLQDRPHPWINREVLFVAPIATSDCTLIVPCRLSAFQEFGDVADDDPFATNEYLVQQLNRFGLAYLHMVEPRVTGAADNEEEHQHQSNAPFRKLFKGTFVAASSYIPSALSSCPLSSTLSDIPSVHPFCCSCAVVLIYCTCLQTAA